MADRPDDPECQDHEHCHMDERHAPASVCPLALFSAAPSSFINGPGPASFNAGQTRSGADAAPTGRPRPLDEPSRFADAGVRPSSAAYRDAARSSFSIVDTSG